MSSLADLIKAGRGPDELEEHLNGLSAAERVEQSRALSPKLQRALWVACEGRAPTLEQIVPAGSAAGEQVIHFGRNTLPAFKIFEKRFCVPTEPSSGGVKLLWGYNEGVTRGLVGPGYFTCRIADEGAPGAVVIDYEQLPSAAPEGWPELRANERGLSRFVYAYMQDYLRRVSDHVTIGRAYRHGKESPNYFTLCR